MYFKVHKKQILHKTSTFYFWSQNLYYHFFLAVPISICFFLSDFINLKKVCKQNYIVFNDDSIHYWLKYIWLIIASFDR